MVTYSRKRLWMALLLSTIAADGARGQWRIVAPQAFSIAPVSGWGGAITYKDGIVWAGGNSLCYSDDSGSTWNQVSSLVTNDVISDISFCNSDTGIV